MKHIVAIPAPQFIEELARQSSWFHRSVFLTVPDADTPWHPQFFCPVIFESQRSTYDSPMVYPNHALRHGDVRIGEPRLSRPLSFGRRNTCALCWPWRAARVRTLKTKLSASWRQLATLLGDVIALFRQTNTCALCWPWRPTRARTLKTKVVSDRLFEDWMATYHPPRIPGNSPFAVKHASIAFTFEARECPNTQGEAGRPVAAIGHYHEDIMAN